MISYYDEIQWEMTRVDLISSVKMIPPINLNKWVLENSDKLKPPVNNYCLYNSDFTVMVVGGPNNRTDYHVNHTPEYFYQHVGSMLLKVCEDGVFKDIWINEGDLFLLPKSIPHNPIRFENTVGIVVECKRPLGVMDSLRWYCEECKNIVYESSFECVDLGVQLKPVIEYWLNNPNIRTCSCGHLNK